MKLRYLLFAGLGLLFVAACGGDPISQELDQTLWQLDSITNAEIVEDPPASIAFAEAEIGGTTGCNTFGGAYRTVPDSDSISIGPLRSTLEACPSEELAVRERAMMASLQSAARYEVTSDGLELRDANGEVLSTYSVLTPSLEETSWVVIGYNTGTESVRSVIIGSEITIEFSDASSVGGSSGCNTYMGGYELSGEYSVVGGQAIEISDLANTEIACMTPEGVMEQEGQYLAALRNSDLWRLVGTNLELRSSDGALQVSAIPSN